MISRERMKELIGEDMVAGLPPTSAAPASWPDASDDASGRFDQMLRRNTPANEDSIPEGEKVLLNEYEKALSEMFDLSYRGKYKLVLTLLGDSRRVNNPTWKGLITFWENGRYKAEGGVDRKVYLCPGRLRRVSRCYALIPDYANQAGSLVCAQCGTRWHGDDVIGECYGNQTPRNWAKTITSHIQARMENSADVVVRFVPPTLRVAVEGEKAKVRHGDLMFAEEAKVKTFTYHYESLARDLANGSLLVDKIYAFLRSI